MYGIVDSSRLLKLPDFGIGHPADDEDDDGGGLLLFAARSLVAARGQFVHGAVVLSPCEQEGCWAHI